MSNTRLLDAESCFDFVAETVRRGRRAVESKVLCDFAPVRVPELASFERKVALRWSMDSPQRKAFTYAGWGGRLWNLAEPLAIGTSFKIGYFEPTRDLLCARIMLAPDRPAPTRTTADAWRAEVREWRGDDRAGRLADTLRHVQSGLVIHAGQMIRREFPPAWSVSRNDYNKSVSVQLDVYGNLRNGSALFPIGDLDGAMRFAEELAARSGRGAAAARYGRVRIQQADPRFLDYSDLPRRTTEGLVAGLSMPQHNLKGFDILPKQSLLAWIDLKDAIVSWNAGLLGDKALSAPVSAFYESIPRGNALKETYSFVVPYLMQSETWPDPAPEEDVEAIAGIAP